MTIYPSTSSRGKPIYIVDYSAMGKQYRKQFPRNPDLPKEEDPGYKDAQKYKKSIEKKIYQEGPSLAALDERDKIAMLHLFDTIRTAGITVQEAEKIIVASTLSKLTMPNVPKVVEDCIMSKKTRLGAGISARYIRQLKSTLGAFSKGFQASRIDEVTPASIEAWVQSGDYSPSSRKSRLTDVRTLFSYAVEQEYIEKNPCDKIKPIILPKKAPGILSPKQAAKLMRVAYNRDRKLCPWLALSLFCGIRPEELQRITRKDIFMDKKIVHISEAASKTGSARNVDIPENALEWLKLEGELAGFRGYKNFAPKFRGVPNVGRRFEKVRRQAGLFKNWPHDAMRHSSVTYLYALTNDDNAVAAKHGHSVRVSLTHYRAAKTPSGEVVTREMAEQYFAIKPPLFIRILESVA